MHSLPERTADWKLVGMDPVPTDPWQNPGTGTALGHSHSTWSVVQGRPLGGSSGGGGICVGPAELRGGLVASLSNALLSRGVPRRDGLSISEVEKLNYKEVK